MRAAWKERMGKDFTELQAEVVEQWGATVGSGVRGSDKSQVWDSLSGLEIKGRFKLVQGLPVTSCRVPAPITLPSPAPAHLQVLNKICWA